MPGGFFLQPIVRQTLQQARVQHFRRRSRQTASACQSGEDVALRWKKWRKWWSRRRAQRWAIGDILGRGCNARSACKAVQWAGSQTGWQRGWAREKPTWCCGQLTTRRDNGIHCRRRLQGKPGRVLSLLWGDFWIGCKVTNILFIRSWNLVYLRFQT